LLGYPKCCTKKQVIFGKDIKLFSINKWHYLLNNFMKVSGSNNYLISHIPCSPFCQQSISQASKLINKMKGYLKGKIKYLEERLKSPMLLIPFIHPEENPLETHADLVFADGIYQGNQIYYESPPMLYYAAALSEDFVFNKLHKVLSVIKSGNRIRLGDNNSLKIYKGNKHINTIEALPYAAISFTNR
ncbi:MAG: hypothetical protein KKA19_01425, partial [Candidatus Margulisbacteria bacterium]|nr:hypothetical protein [Candidatus Margulisiibacteriota bacterium]